MEKALLLDRLREEKLQLVKEMRTLLQYYKRLQDRLLSRRESSPALMLNSDRYGLYHFPDNLEEGYRAVISQGLCNVSTKLNFAISQLSQVITCDIDQVHLSSDDNSDSDCDSVHDYLSDLEKEEENEEVSECPIK